MLMITPPWVTQAASVTSMRLSLIHICSTYLYRAYIKWCEDNLESPVPQKKISQFLMKNAGKYGLTFSKPVSYTHLDVYKRQVQQAVVQTY